MVHATCTRFGRLGGSGGIVAPVLVSVNWAFMGVMQKQMIFCVSMTKTRQKWRQFHCLTRMHSSRMCTARSLTVSHRIPCTPLPPHMTPLPPCMPPCHTCPQPCTPPAMHPPPCMPPLPHMPPTTTHPPPCTPPAMHATPAMHAPCHVHPRHACPPAMHAPCHACPLPCMSPCHACPPAMHGTPHHTCPPVDRILDTHF